MFLSVSNEIDVYTEPKESDIYAPVGKPAFQNEYTYFPIGHTYYSVDLWVYVMSHVARAENVSIDEIPTDCKNVWLRIHDINWVLEAISGGLFNEFPYGIKIDGRARLLDFRVQELNREINAMQQQYQECLAFISFAIAQFKAEMATRDIVWENLQVFINEWWNNWVEQTPENTRNHNKLKQILTYCLDTTYFLAGGMDKRVRSHIFWMVWDYLYPVSRSLFTVQHSLIYQI